MTLYRLHGLTNLCNLIQYKQTFMLSMKARATPGH